MGIKSESLMMMLLKFRQKYPQGSLVSELVEIDRGTYIFKASVEVDNIVLTTAHASGNTIETAEDAAVNRALARLLLDSQLSQPVPVQNELSVASVAPPLPAPTPRAMAATEIPVSKLQSPAPTVNPAPAMMPEPPTEIPRVVSSNPAIPKPAEMADDFIPEPSSAEPLSPPVKEESAPGKNLFGDTAVADIPITPLPTAQASSGKNSGVSPEGLMDFNEIKQKTDIEIKRLNWTKEQGKDFLMSHYGKRSRLHLTDEQLLEFLKYLEQQPSPVA